MAATTTNRPALTEDNGPRIQAAQLTVAILANAAVIFRFWARRIQKAGYGKDDYLILVALPLGWGMCAASLVAVNYGLGRHLITLQPWQLVREGEAYFASEIIWAVAIVFVKLSILAFYIRIFGRLLYVRWLAYGLAAFTVCWGIMVALVCAFQCKPVAYAWNKSIQGGHCIDAWVFFVTGSALNVLTDYAILFLPLPAIWGLQLSIFQKVSLAGIFMLGSLTCIFSTVRLAAVVDGRSIMDPTWSFSNISIWSTAEPCLGIVAACLPAMRPLYTSVLTGFEKIRSRSSLFAKKSGSSDSYDLPSSGAYNNLEHFRPEKGARNGVHTQISSRGVSTAARPPIQQPSGVSSMDEGPLVETSVRWETSDSRNTDHLFISQV